MAQAAGPASAAFAQAQLYTAAASQMAGLQMAHPQAEGSAAANGTGWRHPLEDHALTNLSRSLQAYPLLNGSRVAASPIPAFTADDFRVDDPYQEDPDGSAAPSPPQKQQAAADRALATAMQVSPSPAIPIGEFIVSGFAGWCCIVCLHLGSSCQRCCTLGHRIS